MKISTGLFAGIAAGVTLMAAASGASAAVISLYDTGVPNPTDVLNATGGLTGGDTQVGHGAFTDVGTFVVGPGALLTSYNLTSQSSGSLYTISGGTAEIYEGATPIAATLLSIPTSTGHGYVSVGSNEFTLGAGTYTLVITSTGKSPVHTAANKAYSTYSVELQGSAIPTPEPAAWALMLVGFGGVGGMLRLSRANRKAAIAA
jgi:hypothetical protein